MLPQLARSSSPLNTLSAVLMLEQQLDTVERPVERDTLIALIHAAARPITHPLLHRALARVLFKRPKISKPICSQLADCILPICENHGSKAAPLLGRLILQTQTEQSILNSGHLLLNELHLSDDFPVEIKEDDETLDVFGFLSYARDAKRGRRRALLDIFQSALVLIVDLVDPLPLGSLLVFLYRLSAAGIVEKDALISLINHKRSVLAPFLPALSVLLHSFAAAPFLRCFYTSEACDKLELEASSLSAADIRHLLSSCPFANLIMSNEASIRALEVRLLKLLDEGDSLAPAAIEVLASFVQTPLLLRLEKFSHPLIHAVIRAPRRAYFEQAPRHVPVQASPMEESPAPELDSRSAPSMESAVSISTVHDVDENVITDVQQQEPIVVDHPIVSTAIALEVPDFDSSILGVGDGVSSAISEGDSDSEELSDGDIELLSKLP